MSLGTDAFSDSACTTVAPGGDATDYEPILDADSHATDTDSLVPTTSGTFYIRITNVLATAYTINFIVVETTLFSPWWFTSGSNAAFVEVRNNMSASTTAHLTFYRADGAVCGTSSVIVAGNGNTALSIGVLGTCAGGSGSAQISFPGTPGGMAANITTIDAVNGTSFDSPFTPRMVWGTFTR